MSSMFDGEDYTVKMSTNDYEHLVRLEGYLAGLITKGEKPPGYTAFKTLVEQLRRFRVGLFYVNLDKLKRLEKMEKTNDV